MQSTFIPLITLSALTSISSAAIQPVSNDLWDLSRGSAITATSGMLGYAGSQGGMFGQNGQNFVDESTYSLFSDSKPANFTHSIEWQTPSYVSLNRFRLFAVGDGPSYNNEREFARFTLKAKSVGSSVYDIVVFDYTPQHPYSFLDSSSFLLLDQPISSVIAKEFRAEFLQFTANRGFDGPRIRELDGFGVEVGAVPEPTTWAYALVGSILVFGTAFRRRTR